MECITSSPVIAQPITGKPFIVYSDGSKYAIGGVLAQVIDGTYNRVCFNAFKRPWAH